MNGPSIHELLMRLCRLLQAEDRATGAGLQPVQLHALQYLSRCNRYSDRPAAVAEFLGITKGTASQTLRVLESRGLIAKEADPDDRRVVRLHLTPEGRRVLEESGARVLLRQVLSDTPRAEQARLATDLADLLARLQRANQGRAFGVCRTCRHFRREGAEAFRCGLTGEGLTVEESGLLCREHEASGEAAPSQS